MVPWRVKNFVAERFPTLYHLAINAGRNRNSQEHWDATLARTWDAPNRAWPVKVDEIARALTRETSLIDLGCGTGSILRGLRDRGFTNLHGLDLSQYAVARLSGEGFHMTQGTLLDMPLPDGRFDAVVASEVLEHVIRRGRFMREVSRILRPGGLALIFVPDDCLGPMDEPEHVIKYDRVSLSDFLGRHLEVVSLTSLREPHIEASSLFALCRKSHA